MNSLGKRCLAVKPDVSKKVKVDQMVDKVMSAFGKIDILINNAGVTKLLLEEPEPIARIITLDRMCGKAIS